MWSPGFLKKFSLGAVILLKPNCYLVPQKQNLTPSLFFKSELKTFIFDKAFSCS